MASTTSETDAANPAPTLEADAAVPEPVPPAQATEPAPAPPPVPAAKDRSTVLKKLKSAVHAVIRSPRKLVNLITKDKSTAAHNKEDPSKAPQTVEDVPKEVEKSAPEAEAAPDVKTTDKEIAESKDVEKTDVDTKKPTEETPASVDGAEKSSTTT